jgi:hypothetical protein
MALDGDVRGDNLIIGYIYDMDVELPKFYRKTVSQGSSEADFTSDLIIHRIKVSTGLSGPIKYKIDIEGKELFIKEIDVAVPYLYNLDNVNLSASAVHEIPIYQRNENLKINIVGDTPFPVSLLALNWEGRLGNKFYARTA